MYRILKIKISLDFPMDNNTWKINLEMVWTGEAASQECTYDSWGGIRGITRRVISISREPVALALTINEADQPRIVG